ncbi:hypothetical protein JG688_00006752 [Phytophthora aleatoria]|uniref:Uncharacterized protein n=1 Tax=Phytophthora aleatoria TaxID=2496075 RepID=A0A8J5J0K2_9STRA|nr:hypothetical protein JG688_00006752 [Phytophthora aleatoria]
MFHLQDEENSSSTSVAITARYLVENETSGDFYQLNDAKASSCDGFYFLGTGSAADRVSVGASAESSSGSEHKMVRCVRLGVSKPLYLRESGLSRCEDVAPTAPRFQSGIVVLQVCAILNTILMTAAWLLVALQCSMTMSSSTSNRSRNVELQEALEDKEKRIYKLQGTDLEGSSAEELKSLIQLHQRAIELTEGVLVSKLQALHRPTAAV